MRVWVVLGLLTGCGVKAAKQHALSAQDATAWEALGDAHARAWQKKKARGAYAIALAMDPSRRHLLMTQGGKDSNVVKDLRNAAERDPTDDELWGDLGDALTGTDPLGAQEAYMRAYALDPGDSEWQQRLIDLGMADQLAERAAQTVVDGDDESIGDYADALMAAGRTEEACEQYRTAAELDPTDTEWTDHAVRCGFPAPEVPHGVGYAGEYTEHPEFGQLVGVLGGVSGPQTIESMEERLQSDGGLLTRLGQAYAASGDLDKAKDTLWGAVLVSPTDEQAMQSFLLVSGRSLESVVTELLETDEENDELAGMLADHFLEAGDHESAATWYDRAAGMDGDDPEWEAKKRLLAGSVEP